MNTEQLKKYAELKIEEKRIKEQLDELNPLILQGIQSAGLDEVPTTLGTFVLASRRTYIYPEVITKKEEELKLAKAEAEAKGEAVANEKQYIIFKQKKEITL